MSTACGRTQVGGGDLAHVDRGREGSKTWFFGRHKWMTPKQQHQASRNADQYITLQEWQTPAGDYAYIVMVVVSDWSVGIVRHVGSCCHCGHSIGLLHLLVVQVVRVDVRVGRCHRLKQNKNNHYYLIICSRTSSRKFISGNRNATLYCTIQYSIQCCIIQCNTILDDSWNIIWTIAVNLLKKIHRQQ